ncbi:MAG: YIP1 family protein [Porticoccaceae bacterium]|nr:YIP1 family protein [Porticoccaceae bacterium]
MLAKSFRASFNVLVAPSATFETIKSEKPSWLVPFVLVSGSIIALFLYYFASVDFAWLKEGLLDQMAADQELSQEELAAAGEFLTVTPMVWSSTVGGVVASLLMNAILALYLNIVAKWQVKDEYSYGNWFGFSWWISMPHLVTAILSMLLVLFSTDGMVALEDLGVTTLNSLIFGVDSSNPWFGFLSGLDAFMFWSIALIAIGLKSWLGIDTKKAATIAAAPYALIYGIWALIIIFSA